MSPFFLISQLCFVQPWHNLNLKQLQFTWYYNIQGKNPSDRWFAQFHPLWKHKCYKQQKGRKLLRDAGKYSVSKCNVLYVDKTHWVCEYRVTYHYSGKRSWNHNTVLWKHQAECSGMVQGKNSVKDDYKRNSKHRLSPYKLKFCPHLQFYAQF